MLGTFPGIYPSGARIPLPTFRPPRLCPDLTRLPGGRRLPAERGMSWGLCRDAVGPFVAEVDSDPIQKFWLLRLDLDP